MTSIRKLLKNCQGATSIEYALIASLISIAAIGAMTSVGGSVNSTFSEVSAKLP